MSTIISSPCMIIVLFLVSFEDELSLGIKVVADTVRKLKSVTKPSRCNEVLQRDFEKENKIAWSPLSNADNGNGNAFLPDKCFIWCKYIKLKQVDLKFN